MRSRTALFILGPTMIDKVTFLEMKDSDLAGLSNLLLGKTQLGDGYAKMPWYWRVKVPDTADEGDEVTILAASVNAEYEESTYTFMPGLMIIQFKASQAYAWNGSVHENDTGVGRKR